jgi:Zn finger protein HypA/HybF involved in hydrogenase expression
VTRIYRDVFVEYLCEGCGHRWTDCLRGSFDCPKCGRHHVTAWITGGPNLKIAKLFHERVEVERLMREVWRMHASESGID